MSEKDLYPEIEEWLVQYLQEKYPRFEIEATHRSATRNLESILREFGKEFSYTLLLNIKVDVIGIISNGKKEELVFVEVKDKALTLKDLGQLWGYTQLVNPLESFLVSSVGLGVLSELYNTLQRRDLFVYGSKSERVMKAAHWNKNTLSLDYGSMIPKS